MEASLVVVGEVPPQTLLQLRHATGHRCGAREPADRTRHGRVTAATVRNVLSHSRSDLGFDVVDDPDSDPVKKRVVECHEALARLTRLSD